MLTVVLVVKEGVALLLSTFALVEIANDRCQLAHTSSQLIKAKRAVYTPNTTSPHGLQVRELWVWWAQPVAPVPQPWWCAQDCVVPDSKHTVDATASGIRPHALTDCRRE